MSRAPGLAGQGEQGVRADPEASGPSHQTAGFRRPCLKNQVGEGGGEMSISGLYMHTHTHKHMDAYTTRTQKYTDEKQKCELQVSDNFL